MINEPRIYKWLSPAAGMVCLVPLALWINMLADRNGWAWLMWCNCAVVGLIPLLGIQAWAGFIAYYRRLEVNDYADKRSALTTTAETRLFEYARTMHPETVKLLLMHRRTKWRIKETALNDLVDWVLDADPRIRYEFVEYVLENSNQYAMMPMNGYLSDGAHEFDPDKLITDYEQYRGLHKILLNRAIVTEAFGNQPGQWIEPWTPELVARQFGIALKVDDEKEEVKS